MKLTIGLIKDRVLDTLWFLPVVLVAAGILASLLVVELDHVVGEIKGRLIFGGSPTSARVVTGTLAGSMLSIIGITVPLTIVALQLAASQFTQRILRNFMRDRVVQIFLGVFIAMFAYNLLILRVVRSPDESGETFVPQIAISVGIALSLVALALFIFFVNHIVGLIQVSQVIRGIVSDSRTSMVRLYPDSAGLSTDVDQAPEPNAKATVVLSNSAGYLQAVDLDLLFKHACDRVGTFWIVREIGEFCPTHRPLVVISAQDDDERLAGILRSCFQIGADRTHQEDPMFGLRQLVDIAARALSPGVNDPTTAIQCIDYISELLHELIERSFPSVVRRDSTGAVRLVVKAPSFEDYVAEAFDQIRLYAEGELAVTRRTLQVLAELAAHAPTEARRRTIMFHRDLVISGARRTFEEPADLASVERIGAE